MPLNKLALALSLVLSALPMSALAQEATPQTTGTADSAQTTAEAAPAPAAEEATPALTWNASVIW